MKSKIKIILIAGARPNFMKVAPLMDELIGNKNFEAVLVHTGQHYDTKMSGLFSSSLAFLNQISTLKLVLPLNTICDIFLTTSVDANENLIAEGKKQNKIFMIGNLMIDSVMSNLKKQGSWVLKSLGPTAKEKGKDPKFWDGKPTGRIVKILEKCQLNKIAKQG